MGGSFTVSKIEWIRYAYHIPAGCPERPKGGLIDPLLQSVHLSFELAPGNVCPVFDWLFCNHRFRFFPVTHGSILHLTVSMFSTPI